MTDRLDDAYEDSLDRELSVVAVRDTALRRWFRSIDKLEFWLYGGGAWALATAAVTALLTVLFAWS